MTHQQLHDLLTEAQHHGLTEDDGLHHATGSALILWVQSVGRYYVMELAGPRWWTNDLPLVLPDILPPGAAALRAERFSPCRGPGLCSAWCTAQRSTQHIASHHGQPMEDDTAGDAN